MSNSAANTLRLFECRHSIIWDHLVDQKTTITDLKKMHMELGATLENLREQLVQTAPESFVVETTACNCLNHHESAIEYNKTLNLIC